MRSSMAKVLALATISTAALLGCGKGGDTSPSPSPTPQSTPPQLAWSLVASQTFSFTSDPQSANSKTQGIAYDAQSNTVIFSGNAGLERTDANFNRQAVNNAAIPATLRNTYGSDHIGCVDAFQGEIFAPIEDGAGSYQHPLLAKFDVSDLSFTGQVAVLPRDADQDDGVPWVAIDSARGFAYTMKYNGGTKLNEFSLSSLWTGMPVRQQLALSESLSRVQCGKVNGDYLYVLTDDTQKSVKAINLSTGAVVPVFNLGDSLAQGHTWEAEGLAFFQTANGGRLHLGATSSDTLLQNASSVTIPVAVTVFDFK